mgnify:CR=1 FL=1|tara:strand:- start:397 stop:777 length:381 start_codon:yes stop_codon:yes gene_type:complete
MIKDFLIVSCIGNNDKLGLRINKDFFIHNLDNNNGNEKLVKEISNLLKLHKVKLDNNFTVIVNQGPGSFSGTRISLAVVKGLKISKNVKIFGFKNTDLVGFDQENIEKMLEKDLIEKNLIKPIYLS